MVKLQLKIKNNKILAIEPTRIIVFSFIGLIFWGALLLNMPFASRNGESIGFITSLFTATSATCVTGLVLVDTYSQWSIPGQIIILSLIQIGALGFVTFATFFSIILGRKLGLKTRVLAQESLNHFSFEGILKVIKNVVFVTFAVEMCGALILCTRFVPKYGPKGIYMSIFHSVSAFCNAGFDIMGGETGEFSSLTSFYNDPVVLYTVTSLIIVGGLGFIVWKDIYDYKKTKEFLLHTKIVFIMTLLLITLGTIFFLTFEYNNPNTLGNYNLFEKINGAFFHSVSTRTAGFNTINLNELNEISKFGSIILMFIGAAPGSTGGGVKVTTFGVIIVAIISQIRGSNDTIFLKRKVPHNTINKSLAIIGLSATVVITVTTILLLRENYSFLDMLFEATSAFGTVGLSTFGTPNLSSNLSKVVLIITMFLGRVGPLSFALSLTLRNHSKKELVYPEGKIVVG